MVAAVAAAGGASRAEVAAEARDALMGKAAHLAEPTTGVVAEPRPEEAVGVFTVENPHGLHARPAARLVSEVRTMDASVQLRNLTTGAGPVPAASLSRVATLGAVRGHEVEVRASGPQAQEAVEHLLTLATRRFDEADDDVVEVRPLAPIERRGGPLPASPGIAIGPVRRLTAAPDPDGQEELPSEPAAEWRRVVEAVATARREIEHARVLTAREVGASQAGIFDAHLLLLSDAEMLAEVKGRLASGVGAVAAWTGCLAEVEAQWAELPDPYLRQRAADVRAVGEQVLRALTGQTERRMTDSGVLVATDLTPAETAALDLDLVAGVILADGSPTSHAAILARGRGIPVIVSAGHDVLALTEGTTVVVDGSTGELHVAPSTECSMTIGSAPARLPSGTLDSSPSPSSRPSRGTAPRSPWPPTWARSPTPARRSSPVPTVPGWCGPSSSSSTGRTRRPSRSSRRCTTRSRKRWADGASRCARLDVGGDKPLSYLPMPAEANPFLGQRGIRLSLEHRELLRDQLAAMCETARRFPIDIMFPMVTTPGELIEARQVLTEAAGSTGLPEGLRVGTMIEVPAAALKIEAFLPHLDFVSIGTNDLTQYAMAAERGNGAVAALSDPLDPGVLRLIDHVCRAARGRIDVAVCGEAASDELAVPVLAGLGVHELSVSPAAVPRVKAAVRLLDVGRCSTVAGRALELADADDVRKLVLESFGESLG